MWLGRDIAGQVTDNIRGSPARLAVHVVLGRAGDVWM